METKKAKESGPPSGPRPLWDIKILSRYLYVNERTIYNWMREGKGPEPMKLGKYLRWDPHVVEEWLDEQMIRKGL